MEVKYITPQDYELWNKFCDEHKYATFMHTSYAMEYYIDSSFNIKAKQKSFFVYYNKNLVACVPLFIETINEKKYLSYGGASLPNPLLIETLNSKNKRKVENFIFNKIDTIANEENCIKMDMTISHLSFQYINKIHKYNYLLKREKFLDKSTATCLVDLTLSEEKLFNNFSNGHKQHIKKSLEHLDIEIIDSNNVTKNQVDDFMYYYFDVAGKITRPSNTFNNIYIWIKDKYAILFKSKLKDGTVCGYSLFYIYKDTSYYTMACKKKEYSNMYVSHYIQWKSIIHLKHMGIKYYEMGIQDFCDNISKFISEKDKNISAYKREFGGFIIPVFEAEKFYDKEEFIKCYQERINKYVERNFLNRNLE